MILLRLIVSILLKLLFFPKILLVLGGMIYDLVT